MIIEDNNFKIDEKDGELNFNEKEEFNEEYTIDVKRFPDVKKDKKDKKDKKEIKRK